MRVSCGHRRTVLGRQAAGLRPICFRSSALIVLLAFTTNCTDRAPTSPASDSLARLIVVSGVVPGSSAPSSAAVTQRATPPSTPPVTTVVYVSLPPHSVDGASIAVIRNVALSDSVTVAIIDGGFDPTPIAAGVGDLMTIEVRAGSSALFSTSTRVPPHRPPQIIRSVPPNGKTDVPLNTRIEVVFSEPIDPTSLSSSLQLVQGTRAVAGAATLDASGLLVTFAPDTLLASEVDYTIAISTGLHSLAGVALQQDTRIHFTTGSAPAPPVEPSTLPLGAFARVGPLDLPRKGAATLLPDGRVLIVGGTADPKVQPQAEVYDPSTRTFAAADNMMTTRGGHPAVSLPNGQLSFLDGIALHDGRVLFVAPVSITLQLQMAPLPQLNTAEIYDPASGIFAQIPYAHSNSFWDTATLLQDGRVLLTGSTESSVDYVNASEIFDPQTSTFRATTAMKNWYDTSGWGTLLDDGTVLFVQWCFDLCSDQVELYDPSNDSFTIVGTIGGDLPYSRAVRLADGRVLITGGQVPGGNGTSETVLYLPASRRLVQGPTMIVGRHQHSATLLSDGSVLIAGGYSVWSVGLTPSAEIFRPAAP